MKGHRKSVVLATGGTGGHIFPAHAVAYELLSHGFQVFIFTDERGAQFKESSMVTFIVPARHIQGTLVQKLKGVLTLIRGVGVAFYQLLRIKPHAVVGFGGYASFPSVVAASFLRLPTVVHQADAYLGRVNRLLAFFVRRVATSFPRVENIPTSCASKVVFTGLPVRPDIESFPYLPVQREGPICLLVTGGSQGAKIFGEVLPRAIALLPPSLQERLFISQQCRQEFLERTQTLYKATKAHIELSPFLNQMGERYKKAHLLISRAGASSVMESAYAGRPALFIPYPYAMDDHQFYNAQQAAACGGGWFMRENEFTPQALANLLLDLITFPWKLETAAANIQKIACPDASLRLAQLVRSMM